jgi:adenylate kinase
MKNLVLFGPPGAGKGTQSEKLIQKYGFVHISTGDLFRWHTKNDTPLGKRVKEIKNPQAKGFLFDGFPRTVPQAEALDKFMKDNNSAIHFIVALDVTEAEVRTRIAKRRTTESRVDDEEEKLNKRITEYFTKTIHVLPFYEKQGRLNTVQGIGEVNTIFGNICKVLDH